MTLFVTINLLKDSLLLSRKDNTGCFGKNKQYFRYFGHIRCKIPSVFISQCIYVLWRKFYSTKYDCKIETAINKQIQVEQQAAQEYLNIAVTFRHQSLSRPGAGGYFMRMYEEELGHMKDFIQYQIMRGGVPLIVGLTAPKQYKTLTLLEAFQKALEMEKSVTEDLDKIVVAAESVKDYHCADFVTSVFLAEQMRSISEIAHHVQILSRLGDEHAIYHYDTELAKTYPYSYK